MNFKLLNEEEIVDNRNVISSPFPLINAVVWGKQEGKIFSTDHNFFIIHKARFSYFRPQEGFADYDTLLDFLIQSKELPAYFHVYDPPAKLLEVCIKKAGLLNIKVRSRIQLKLNERPTAERPVGTPPGFYIEPITTKNLPLLSVFNLDLPNKFWRSEQDFLQNGFGYCVFTAADEPAAICYSACIAGKLAEIDVATLPSFQKKGLAKVVVAACIQHSVDNGIMANWDCFEDNEGSLKTAYSLRFKKKMQYNFLSIYKKV